MNIASEKNDEYNESLNSVILNLLGVRGWPVITFYPWWWGVWSEWAGPRGYLQWPDQPRLLTTGLLWLLWTVDWSLILWPRHGDMLQMCVFYNKCIVFQKVCNYCLKLLDMSCHFLGFYPPTIHDRAASWGCHAGRWDLLKSIRSRQSVTVAGDNPVQKHKRHKWREKTVKVGSEYI